MKSLAVLIAIICLVVPLQAQSQDGQPWENSLGMKFVPAGTPGVLFCIWLTREQDYLAFVKATKADNQTTSNSFMTQGAAYPVGAVHYKDATDFCQWLTDKERAEGKLGPNQSYRLPTDDEWTAAAGTKTKYIWGDAWPPPAGAGNFKDESVKIHSPDIANYITVITGYNDGFPDASPVGSFKANSFGLFDMAGNLTEWCDGWYHKEMNSLDLREEFRGAADDGGGSKYRFYRGGSHNEANPHALLIAFRIPVTFYTAELDNGFRCVLVVTPPAKP
jgi:formylglycine-generating enzyme required for sulfatase activity